MYVENLYSPRTVVAVANQFVIHDEEHNKTTFQSYSSRIMELDRNNKTLYIGCNWDYSVTTSKYRNQFVADYLPYELRSTLATKKGIMQALKDGQVGEWRIIQ